MVTVVTEGTDGTEGTGVGAGTGVLAQLGEVMGTLSRACKMPYLPQSPIAGSIPPLAPDGVA